MFSRSAASATRHLVTDGRPGSRRRAPGTLAEAPPVISEDHLTYTFKIRDGVKWHDGRPFTSDDVLFTFKAVACRLTDTAPLRSYLTDLKDIQVDGRTIRFLMSKPNAYNVNNIANSLAIVPKHIFDPEGLLDAFS